MRVYINGEIFPLYKVSTYDGNLHLRFNPDGFGVEEIRSAIESGSEPIRITDDAGNLLNEYTGYTHIEIISVNYSFKYSPMDLGTCIEFSIRKEIVTPQELLDVQMALAELAELIAGGNSNG